MLKELELSYTTQIVGNCHKDILLVKDTWRWQGEPGWEVYQFTACQAMVLVLVIPKERIGDCIDCLGRVCFPSD